MQRCRHPRWRPALLVAALVLFPLLAAGSPGAAAPSPDPWSRWLFLLGDWQGEGAGAPGQAAGAVEFHLDLERHVLVRRNRVDYAPKPGEKNGFSHEDLLLMYLEPPDTTLRGIYFDSEGHVIHYRARLPEGEGTAALESEGGPGDMRYRLDYALQPDGKLKISFSMAPPGAAYHVYAEGVVARKK